MTKLVKEFLNEDHNLNAADESSVAEKQINTICRTAEKLKTLVMPGMQLDADIQSKLAVVEDKIVEIATYLESEQDAPEVLEPQPIGVPGDEEIVDIPGEEVELGGDELGDEEIIDEIPGDEEIIDEVPGEELGDDELGDDELEGDLEADLEGDELEGDLEADDEEGEFDDEEMLMGMLGDEEDEEDTGGFKEKKVAPKKVEKKDKE